MAFCANCGASVTGRFCQKCGTPVATAEPGAAPPMNEPPPGMPPPGAQSLPPPAVNLGMSDNMAAALCYLVGFITGILFLVMAPYNQNRTVRFHAFQSIFLNIAWIALWIVLTVLALILHVIPVLGTLISVVLQFTLGVGGFFIWLYLMFKTYNGDKVVLPVIGPLAEKQAGV